MISFSAVCLGPKFNMAFESEMWLSNASVAPGTVAVYKKYTATLPMQVKFGVSNWTWLVRSVPLVEPLTGPVWSFPLPIRTAMERREAVTHT